ncbi:MAG TPA: POTRA domain-containing protein, partial [Gemmataceae bacterium]
KVKVSGIDFVGNHAASSGRLRTQLVSGRAVLGFIGGTYDPAQTELDVARLLDYYKTLGFHRVRVTPETIWSDDFSRVRLV